MASTGGYLLSDCASVIMPRGAGLPLRAEGEIPNGVAVLDIVYLLVVVAVFAVVGVVAWGVEKL